MSLRTNHLEPAPIILGVCLVTRATVPPEFMFKLVELQTAAKELGWTVVIVRLSGCSMLAQARSHVASRALDGGADVTLWIDDDMTFEVSDALSLARRALHSGSIVGAAASQRASLGRMNIDFLPDAERTALTFFGEGAEVAEVKGIGLGMTAISRDVFEKVAAAEPLLHVDGFDGKPAVAYFHELISERKWYGEDMSFCVRARRAGARVFVDTHIRLGHVGSYEYQLEDTMGRVPRLGQVVVEFKEPPHG